MGLTESVISTGASELFKNIVVELYAIISRSTNKKVRQWKTEKQIDNLYRKIWSVRLVKTIWQVDRSVDIMSFYCESHVRVGNERRVVRRIADLGTEEHFVIQGIAGQGKSILLRYLCAAELTIAEFIPVFVELRKISKTQTLRDRIYAAFKGMNLSIDDEVFEALASSGKILLLLDAFDEILDPLKSEVIRDIEDLCINQIGIRIVVTTRPDSDIEMISSFVVVQLDNLRRDEHIGVIRKLSTDQDQATTLIRHIEGPAKHVQGLLITPLMVTLLVLSYKSYQKLPARVSDFYDSLFQTLLQRHDGTKPGFSRARSCALDDRQYREVFEAMCIISKKENQQSLSHGAILDLAKHALSKAGFSVSPEKFIKDIVKITCLILRDGEEYRFIHKTVQEYYAASFVVMYR